MDSLRLQSFKTLIESIEPSGSIIKRLCNASEQTGLSISDIIRPDDLQTYLDEKFEYSLDFNRCLIENIINIHLFYNICNEDIYVNGNRFMKLYTAANKPMIDELLTRGISLYYIGEYGSRFIQLYTSENRQLIDKLFSLSIHLYDIVKYGPKLIELYTIENSLAIDILLSHSIDLYNIVRYGIEFFPLYTTKNKKIIVYLLSHDIDIYSIVHYGNDLIQLYTLCTRERQKLLDKLLDKLFDKITANRIDSDPQLSPRIDLYEIAQYCSELIELYTSKSKPLIDILLD